MKDKIAFVCQRYGLEVNGGAELLCRQLAGKMSEIYDVEVYTTCARDYAGWKNEYRPGTETIRGITVHRFPVLTPRSNRPLRAPGELLEDPSHSDEDEEAWIEANGPYCPDLLNTLHKKQTKYRAIIFITYLFYPTAMGLPMHFENAFLLPTAHDEPSIHLRHYEKVFCSAKGLIWLTQEEKEFAEGRFPAIRNKPSVLAGSGVNLPSGGLPEIPREIRGVPYIAYVGRIDPGKGCDEMFQFFLRYKQQYGGELRLVLMGKSVMPVPESDNIVNLGFVTDEMKFAVLNSARALVLFSPLESLSIVVLESMAMGRPVLVNGKCAVLKGHCVRSNAGLYFENYWEFAETLNYILTHEQEYQIMRENGKRYVEENYRWDAIVQRIKGLIE